VKDQDLKKLGIQYVEETAEKPRLTIGLDGLPKTGKTTWAMGMPGPLGVISNDPMTKRVVQRAKRDGKEIYLKTFPETEDKKIAEKEWARYLEVYAWMLENLRSVIIDTDTGSWDLQRMAAFGKLTQVMPNQYVEVNRERRRIIRMSEDSNCNVCFVFKQKKKYMDVKRRTKQGVQTVSSWTGEFERAGFSETAYLLQVNMETIKENPGDLDVEERFKVKVVNCTQNAELDGEILEYPVNDFTSLAMMVFPESVEGDWQ
jgi:hypothetical protein